MQENLYDNGFHVADGFWLSIREMSIDELKLHPKDYTLSLLVEIATEENCYAPLFLVFKKEQIAELKRCLLLYESPATQE
jgi:hypothetical protein